MNKNSVAPIIVIGSHRAGTSMICRVLEDLGVFMGWKRDENNEAEFFITLNQWMLTSSSANWDSPENSKYIFQNQDLFELTYDYVDKVINSPHLIEYLGLPKYIKYDHLKNIDFNWGWKDPRNTFTLPLWLKMFPDAKVIHVHRHGVDVAQSLFYRNNKGIKEGRVRHEKRKYLYNFIKKKGPFTGSNLCVDFDNCFNIWEKYIQKSFEYEKTIENKFLTIKYEEFLNTPESFITGLVNFCDLDVKQETISEISAKVNKNRAYAFKKNEELVEYSNIVQDRLSKFGY